MKALLILALLVLAGCKSTKPVPKVYATPIVIEWTPLYLPGNPKVNPGPLEQ
jgi:predicted component of type VI protein secretion system